jgi:muramidase (phage lysozyme)
LRFASLIVFGFLGASSLAHASTNECAEGEDVLDEWLWDILGASEEAARQEQEETGYPNPHLDTETTEEADDEEEEEEERLTPEERAALATIRYAEGADYDRLFGWFEDKSRVFDPYTQIGHPNLPYTSRGGRYTSSAAGAYQAMPKTWAEEVRKGTISNDFTPDNQDQFALARLRYRGLLDEVQSGDTSWIDSRAMGREWASFPNSPYGQPTHSSSDLRSYYYEKLNEYQSSD